MRTLTIVTLLIGGCASAPDQQPSFSAARYRSFERVDAVPRAAPSLCRPPVDDPRVCASRDESTHGRKLYFLYAKDRAAYLKAGAHDQPDGQVVVKESWFPGVERTKGPLFLMMKSGGDWTYATAPRTVARSWRSASSRPASNATSLRGRATGCSACSPAPPPGNRSEQKNQFVLLGLAYCSQMKPFLTFSRPSAVTCSPVAMS